MLNTVYKLSTKIKLCKKGAIAIYFGLAMPVFIGFSALAFDASLWLMERRILQNTVDAATMAAAYTEYYGGDNAAMLTAATADAANNGFTVGGDNTLVVNSPPISGKYTGQTGFVQATTTEPAQGFFTEVMGMNTATIVTTATAGTIPFREACLLALAPHMAKALNFTGSGVIQTDCGVASNSDHPTQSIYLNGNIDVETEPSLSSAGGIYEGGSSSLSEGTATWENDPPITDPYLVTDDYGNLVLDEYGDVTYLPTLLDPEGCNLNNTFGPGAIVNLTPEGAAAEGAPYSYSAETGVYTFEPGQYCGTVPFNSGDNIVLNEGIYVFDSGDFTINSTTSIMGDGVTIILTAELPADIGNISIQGGDVIQLSAQSEGDYAGLLFYQDHRVPYENNANIINGNSNTNLAGAFYFPSSELQYNGTSGTNSCTQIIAYSITISGNNDTTVDNYEDDPGESESGELESRCTLMGYNAAFKYIVALVE